MSLPIPLDLIDDNPYQPRQHYDEEKLGELAAAIKQHGLLQPPIARIVDEEGGVWPLGDFYNHTKTVASYFEENPDRRVQIAFGHRRLRAIRRLGWKTMKLDIQVMLDEPMDMLA